jgi:hypothetical protein
VAQHDLARGQEPSPQCRAPVAGGSAGRGVDPADHLPDHGLDEPVEQAVLAGQVVVERHRLDPQLGGEAAHRQRR